MLRKRCAKREHVGSRATMKRARTSFKRNVVKNVKSSCLEDSEPSYLDGEADIYQRVFSSEIFYTGTVDECSEKDIYFADEANSSDDKLPVRVLKSFTFYDLESRRILPLLDAPGMGASGKARPHYLHGLYEIEEDWDENGDDMDDAFASWEPVKLNEICSIYLDKNFVNPEIWVQTSDAWYILDTPAHNYKPFLDVVYKPHLLTCIVVSNKKYTFSNNDMQGILESGSDLYVLHYTQRILGRDLVLGDFIHAQTEIRDNLRPLRQRPQIIVPDKTTFETTPFITEVVGRIAQELFLSLSTTTGTLSNDCLNSGIHTQESFVVHEDDPTHITWGKSLPDCPGFYESIILDGVEYKIGDAVAVEPGSDSNHTRATNASLESSRTDNELANRAWFCKVIYFFETQNGRKTEMLFHARWFEHGARTVLAETADPQALYLLDSCDSVSVSAILQKIDIRKLDAHERELAYSDDQVASASFYYRYKWKDERFTFMNPLFDDEEALMDALCVEAHKRCYPCSLKYRDDLEGMAHKNPSRQSIRIFGIEYHVDDFVYIKHREPMLAIDSDDLSGFPEFRPGFATHPIPCRSLLPTDEHIIISADCIDGRCYVMREEKIEDLEAWTQNDDAYFVARDEMTELKQCERCAMNMKHCKKAEAALKSDGKLLTMDIFSGAGGLTTGMDMSGFVETKWVIERSTSACKTIRKNHLDVKVYNQDCNMLLKHAVEGKKKPLYSVDGSERLPPLPLPGEVDLIIGGPPCQAFSGMNRYKKADDIRLTLIPTMLSYVEYYHPKYVLIENVTGMLYFQLRGKQDGLRIIDGVRAGMVKCIMRTFVGLGYQVQVRVLNAADYGAPQQRNRVIFWASKLDIRLPKWPMPTHIPRNGHNATTRKVATVGWIPTATRHPMNSDEGHAYAPFYSSTVFEAIDDLVNVSQIEIISQITNKIGLTFTQPAFHWESPYKSKVKSYDKDPETCFPADSKRVPPEYSVAGYDHPVLYRQPPRTPYQAWCRQGLGNYSRVCNHYTGVLPPMTVERTVNIALRPGANHKTLPPELQLRDRDEDRKKDLYRRLDGDGEFRTMMATSVRPDSKGVCIVHPTQRRVLTVREYARAQGFPDYYEFESVEESRSRMVEDEYRQIGNAVPITLALALAKGLGQGLVQDQLDTHGSKILYPII